MTVDVAKTLNKCYQESISLSKVKCHPNNFSDCNNILSDSNRTVSSISRPYNPENKAFT